MRPTRIEPGAGQESAWDYPRPPRVEPTADLIVVEYAGHQIAHTTSAQRVLETSQPPAFYIPRTDVDMDLLTASPRRTPCEWKGEANYFDLNIDGSRVREVAWSYESPMTPFLSIAGHLAFYAQKVSCSVAGEAVDPNEGSFYGGWITSKVVGPFKGGPGSAWW